LLSFGLPFALVPLLIFTANRNLMGQLVNRGITTAAMTAITLTVLTLNVYLVLLTIRG
jgi:manganese transport protein